ncbi:hypothetical protein GH714_031271 [Hevea brasiliensis]|uniref:Exonuclease domain-containing protein n=1 Tax=Hevea brasiliensis TaxID=3981 RepID=A0A6A6LGR6_HEVBR|nr:hypothetical protein GH714_031271 [Hevea brasiliensis]
MMALENKETIQRSSEASLKCLQTNGFPYGNSNDGFPELKEEISVHSGGDVVEPVHSISSEFLELPSELHSKPTYHHDFGSRSTFYPDSKSATGQLEACFETYVRPTCNQLLSDFCKDLTGIQQIQVDRGVTLSKALLRHDKWLEKKGIKNTNFAVVTLSNWDCRVMLESECRFKKIWKPPYFNRWINLRIPFREVFGGVRCNQKEAVKMAGLAWQGRAHCGLDDAKNTALLLALLMRRGIKNSPSQTHQCGRQLMVHCHGSRPLIICPSHWINPTN